MQITDRARARAAAVSVASNEGLEVDAARVLNDSNKLTVYLSPCQVVARVAPAAQQNAQFELDIALQLARSGRPVVAPEARVPQRTYEHDGFVITLWPYSDPVAGPTAGADYADALHRLHAGMRRLDVAVPHFTTRIDEAQRLAANRELTPDLNDADRHLLATTLSDLRRSVLRRGAAEQVLHGEPHPGNVLNTNGGVRFIDFETCCSGPVEFDIAHAPVEVGEHYPGIDRDLLRECRTLVLAMVTTWRWDPTDEFPDGRRLAHEWLDELRNAPVRRAT